MTHFKCLNWTQANKSIELESFSSQTVFSKSNLFPRSVFPISIFAKKKTVFPTISFPKPFFWPNLFFPTLRWYGDYIFCCLGITFLAAWGNYTGPRCQDPRFRPWALVVLGPGLQTQALGPGLGSGAWGLGTMVEYQWSTTHGRPLKVNHIMNPPSMVGGHLMVGH